MLEEITQLNERVERVENDLERLFTKLAYFKSTKTDIINYVSIEVCKYFEVDIGYFHRLDYKAKAGRPRKVGRPSERDIESLNCIEAKYWLCSILYNWFNKDLAFLESNYIWFNRTYVNRFNKLFTDAITPKEKRTREQQKVRDTYILLMQNIRQAMIDDGVWAKNFEEYLPIENIFGL